MNLTELFISESVKAIPNVVIAVITLVLGWFVGSRISSKWTLIQKRKELDLVTAQTFHKLYGDFFSLWKLWNYFIRDIGEENLPEGNRWDLLDRACTAEASVESLFVRLATERTLTADELELLGKYRQAYQQLREAIRDNEPLKWDWSKHPDYQAFKQLGARVAYLILSDNYQKPKNSVEVMQALQHITDNKWEYGWTEYKSNHDSKKNDPVT